MKFTRANFEALQNEVADLKGKNAWLKKELAGKTLLDGATPELVEAVAKVIHEAQYPNAAPLKTSEYRWPWFEAAAHAALGAIVAHENAEVTGLRARVAQLEKDAKEAKGDMGLILALTVECDALTARIADLEKERDEALRANCDCNGNTWEDYSQKLKATEARIADLTARVGHLTCALESAERDVDYLRRENADLTKPREVDETMVEEMAKVLAASHRTPATSVTPDSMWMRDARAILAAFPPGGVMKTLDDAECDRLWGAYCKGYQSGVSTFPGRDGVRALLAAAGRMYVAPESKGPAPNGDLHESYTSSSSYYGGLRAVYDLGRSHGCDRAQVDIALKNFQERAEKAEAECARLSEHNQIVLTTQVRQAEERAEKAEKENESLRSDVEHLSQAFVPFVPDDALVEKMARVSRQFLGMTRAWEQLNEEQREHQRQEFRAALSALPPLFVAAATEDHDLDPPQPVHLNEEKLVAAHPLGKPERLPFRGLTKEEATQLTTLVRDSYDPFALQLLAKACGVTE